MAIRIQPDAHRYATPVFAHAPASPLGDARRLFGRTRVIYCDSEVTESWDIDPGGDPDEIALHLMAKKLMGEQLTEMEQLVVAAAHARRRAAFVAPPPESEEITAAVEIAKRALARRGISRFEP